MDIYFFTSHGAIAYRHDEQIPCSGDAVTFENLTPEDYVCLYRRFIYKQEKETCVHIFLEEDNNGRQ